MIGVIRNQKRWDRAERRRKARKEYRNHMRLSRKTKRCDSCGGNMSWCSICETWTKTCCVDYGTCQCN